MNIGIAYIIIPTNIEVEKYKNTVFASAKVSIVTDENAIYHEVPLDKQSLQLIEFPDLSRGEVLGSPVAYFQLSESQNKPVIFAVYQNGEQDIDCYFNEFLMRKSSGNSYSQIFGNGDGTIGISSSSNSDKKAVIQIDATGSNKDSLIQIESNNDIEVHAEAQIHIHAGDKIVIGKEELEPAVLGNTLQELLEMFIQILAEGAVLTSNGPAPFMPDTQARLMVLKAQLASMKSELIILQ